MAISVNQTISKVNIKFTKKTDSAVTFTETPVYYPDNIMTVSEDVKRTKLNNFIRDFSTQLVSAQFQNDPDDLDAEYYITEQKIIAEYDVNFEAG